MAALATAAVTLSFFDSAIPSPLPGVKPGLANIVTLIVLWRYGWSQALWVTLLRVVASSLVLGFFLAPGFFLSLSGALCSLAALALGQTLPRRYFGAVSLSIIAAFAHLSGQIILARLWLIAHDGVFLLIPLFAVSATVFGLLNGLIAAHLLQQTPTGKNQKIE